MASPDDEPERITIEVYPDYIETIIIALQQKAKWHSEELDPLMVDDMIVRWIDQIIADLEEQTSDIQA